MPPQPVPTAIAQPVAGNQRLARVFFVTASAKQISVEFWELAPQHNKPFDQFTIDLVTHTVG
jgi:predicted NACHT family NTPase